MSTQFSVLSEKKKVNYRQIVGRSLRKFFKIIMTLRCCLESGKEQNLYRILHSIENELPQNGSNGRQDSVLANNLADDGSFRK